MYACMYVCMYVCMYIHVHTCCVLINPPISYITSSLLCFLHKLHHVEILLYEIDNIEAVDHHNTYVYAYIYTYSPND